MRENRKAEFEVWAAALRKRFPALFENLPEWAFCVRIGWFSLMEDLCAKLALLEGVRLNQVKEKFGGLRIYTEILLEGEQQKEMRIRVKELVDLVENISTIICEECSKSANKITTGGYIHTLCDECKIKSRVSYW